MDDTKPRRHRVLQRDVLVDLDEMMHAKRPGTANSDINVFALECSVTYELLERLRREIERLRALVKS
jgi:hypothetical protein